MTILKRALVTLIMVITLCFSFLLIGNMVGNSTPLAIATVTYDEASLCVELNTYLSTQIVDVAGLLECLAHMNQD